ncbi:MAG: deoxyguanosinetriphosphate triphosphohydrolase [Eubacteriales bacterium]|nr:deoxyguanosinetriphosphate triphosphohydrolase [Eubacteriales bacterium]
MNWSRLLCGDRIRSYQKSGKSSDLRTEFEKDYHRIIGSASFRRLQDKTQVFPLDQSDFIRTRLTHSLEVSSFCKSLGQNISEQIMRQGLDPEFDERKKAAVCDILQCAGLIHDIGNPPFGHFGETAIQDWFKKHLPRLTFREKALTEVLSQQMQQDLYHFEGNTQVFRLVTKLHFLVDEHGMNLTKALLGTIIKYPVSSLEINEKSGRIREKKMGYFYADREAFADVQRANGTNGCRHPLAFLLEAADDIAYRTADIEDALKKGCITYSRLSEELKSRCEGAPERCRRMIGWLEDKYQKAVDRGYERPETYAVQNWVVSVQGEMIASATESFASHYGEIMDGTWEHDLFWGTFGAPMMKALGDIAYQYAFISRPIIKLEIGADAIFDFLLSRFVDAVIPYDTNPAMPMTAVQKKLISLISDNHMRVYRICGEGKDEAEKLYLRLLLVTDFISGMTDSYAKRLYQELNGIA